MEEKNWLELAMQQPAVLGVVPIFVYAIGTGSDLAGIIALCVTILLEGIGCMAFIYGGVYQAAMDKLLEEGDYTRKNMASESKKDSDTQHK